MTDPAPKWPFAGNPDENIGSRHHFVPKFYLRRFANNRDQVRRVDVRTGESHVLSISDVAAERDFYTYVDVEGELCGRVEQLLGHVEGRAERALSRVSNPIFGQAFPPDLQTRADLVTMMAFQHVRGKKSRRRMERFADLMAHLELGSLSREQLERRLAADGVYTSEDVESALRLQSEAETLEFVSDPNEHIGSIPRLAEQIGEELWKWSWYIYDFKGPCLLTCDEPVALSFDRGNESPSHGLLGADEVYFALNPRTLLALQNPTRRFGEHRHVWDTAAAARLNQVIAQNSYEYVFEHPDVSVHPTLPPYEELPPFMIEGGPELDRYNAPLQARRTQRRRRRNR